MSSHPIIALTVTALLAIGGLRTRAFADTPPTRWDRARDPAVGDAWDLHARVCEFMAQIYEAHDPSNAKDALALLAMSELRLQQARGELESADAAASADVRLRFDLGHVYEQLGHYQQAIDVLQPALAMAPDHPAASSAWFELASAYARQDRTREERDTYEAYLERTPDGSGRAVALLDRAEADMRLGNLDEAVMGYRDALDTCEAAPAALFVENFFKTGVLARWGLAVALDRSGDASGAAREALLASQLDPKEGIINDQEMCGTSRCIFFVPDYELDWYLGLGRAEHAKQEPDPQEAAKRWKSTEETWADYVSHADPKDRWLPLARAHLATTHKRRAAAEKRAALHRRAPGAPRLTE